MTQANAPKFVAAIAAVATTLVLFSAVVSIADGDQATQLAAKIAPVNVAAR